LLIFDNADDLSIVDAYWPSAEHGSVIVTTQNTTGRAYAQLHLELNVFSHKHSIEHLQQTLGLSDQEKESEDVTNSLSKIAKNLGCHPLAMDQMASFIVEAGCSLDEFLDMYSRREEANTLQQANSTSPWYWKPVAAAFDISVGRLNGDAGITLDLLSFFDPDKIPDALISGQVQSLPNLKTVASRRLVMQDLRRYSLISAAEGQHTTTIHRLVRDAVLRTLSLDDKRQLAALQNSLALLRQAFPLHGRARGHMTERWDECEEFLPHVLSFHQTFLDTGQDGSELASTLAELLYSCAW
jgi:hypothetical protein